GEVVWIGAGEGRVALYLRDDAPLLAAAAPPAGDREVPGTVVTRVADSLQDRGALFFRELVELAGEQARAVLGALWEAVWGGGGGRGGPAVGAGVGRPPHHRRLASAAVGRSHPASHGAAAGAAPPRP